MKKPIFILSTLICLQTFGKATLFTQGNTEYANENYSVAISIYDSIISMGLESTALYYNLGNCYYKTQDWANAIWHYEKSLKLNPNNEDASYNLELAQLQIIDQIKSIPQLFYKKWWKNLVHLFTTKTWQMLAILCIWIVLIIQLLNRFTNYKKKYLPAFFNTLALILLCITYSSYEENHSKTEAIIFASSVVVNSAPTENSTNLFSLHSGTKVELIDQIGNWINITLTNGNSGWIKESDCKILQ
ncbi:MAG: tetratricopeptide repeat protein [Bacteroidota bacterium]|nr:tetratricopeptide repeat protein [Bacteroidota bacterium]